MYVGRRQTAGYRREGDVIVTDFDAASARGYKATAAIVLIGLLGVGLGGCETASSIFGSTGGEPAVEIAKPAAPVAPQPIARVALAPIIGAPEPVAKQISKQLAQSSERQRVVVLEDRDAKADYTLRGYIVASRDKAGIKVSYIWDLADQTGKRVNRITGEEVVGAAPNAKDPWASVTPAVVQTIADKTASSLGSWVPSQAPAAVPVATNGAASSPAAGAGAGSVSPSGGPVANATAMAATTTAALPKSDEVSASVPVVGGAPGDGNSALATALQRELSRQGVALTERNDAATYKVEGKVSVGAVKDGKDGKVQAIQIDWRVKDPQGKSLGTVSQKNEIPPGSLDGAWGKTADAAAAAAAQGIVKLLPQPKSTN